MTPEELRAARKAFSNICRGFSVVLYEGKKLYLKHLTHHDQVDFDVIYDKNYQVAKLKSVPTERERLEYLMEVEDSWSQEDEEWLKSQSNYIKSLVDGKKNCILPKQVEKQNEKIHLANKEYSEKLKIKNKLIGMTCEVYADRRLNEYYIVESFYKDQKLAERYFDGVSLDDINEDEMTKIVIAYNEQMNALDDESIKKAAIQDFVQLYWSMSPDNVYDFFGKPICDLTYQQVRLINYIRTFRNIIIHNQDIPEDVRYDPNRLLDYANTSENVKKQMQKTKGDAQTLFGAKKEDYEQMGIDKNVTYMSDELKKSGKKSLNMRDLMNIMG